MKNWICTRCSNDEKVKLYTLRDGRKRPFCLRHMPARKDIAAVHVEFKVEKTVIFTSQGDCLPGNTPGGKVMNEPCKHEAVATDTGRCVQCGQNVDGPSKPDRFKVGMWYRQSAGIMAGELMQCTTSDEDRNFGITSFRTKTKRVVIQADDADAPIEPALPRAGEWWKFLACPQHGRPASFEPVMLRGDGTVDGRARCGCLVPVNFGKGVA